MRMNQFAWFLQLQQKLVGITPYIASLGINLRGGLKIRLQCRKAAAHTAIGARIEASAT